MSTQQTTICLGAVRRSSSFDNGNRVRVSFVPFGDRKVGDPDPDAPGYQIIDGRAINRPTTFASRVRLAANLGISESRLDVVHVEDVSGRRFVVADGEAFSMQTDTDLPDWAELSLGDCGPVLAAPASDDEGGYVAVGTRTVLIEC